MNPEGQAAGVATTDAADAADTPQPLASTTVYLSLGANLGDRRQSLRLALQRLADHPQVLLDTKRDVARLFQTSPVGGEDPQPPYLNTAARIRTTLSPTALLALIHRIESDLGRVRSEEPTSDSRGSPPTKNESKYQPRTIDIDILFYGDLVCRGDCLEIPHPRLAERRFVLEPLTDLAPDRPLRMAGQTLCRTVANPQTIAEAALASRRRYPHQAAEEIEKRGWAD